MKLIASALITLILAGTMPAITPSCTEAAQCVSQQVETLAFTSKSCRQCQLDKNDLAQLRADGHLIREIDVDDNPEIAKRYNITFLPTYVVEQDGVEIQRTEKVGSLSALLIAVLFWMFCSWQ